jgi:CRP/FNR family cyclic AMP-dependent transcriptional regulator
MRLQSSHDCNARKSCLFSGLDQLRLRNLERIQRREIYPSGSTIFVEGDEPLGIYCICSGKVKLSISSFDGRTIVTGIAASGDLIGKNALLLGKPYILTAEAVETSQLCFIKRDNFIRFLSQNADAGLKLAIKFGNELYEAYSGVRDITFKRSYERFVELLLKLCRDDGETTPQGIILKIDLNRDELAEMIGTSSRNLTRVIMKLTSLGLIECGRQQFLIRNRAALEKIIVFVSLFVVLPTSEPGFNYLFSLVL